ncbi:mitochondrial inner membrane protein OXA1L, putative [Pediculus humanus corporis]|uniref:Mitochondrial inner membrane protein OXA1L, putative n=1 Tax=Pediculus humanus subsp. corporis TaxID=121224 RepID=E0V9R1_PEDHC|nr:mitochondrial inner membrane protein OXA1L, putative [Pediculus humanus corporis]EEB10117.1 mitochondrial inner membrane protein OXA1L, putative [Pediculus humanus corporis]
MQNNLPQIQGYQNKINEAKLTGNYYEVAHHVNELQEFMKTKQIGALGFFIPAFAQAPIFLSMFWGLRAMTNLPVESMKTGGLFWFTDLTVPDPYYVLPVMVSCTFFAIMETGAEGNSMGTIQQIWLRYLFRFLPVILFPITMNFPAALQCYWTMSNLTSLGTVLFLKIPAVANYFQIPKSIKHDPSLIQRKDKLSDFKSSK